MDPLKYVHGGTDAKQTAQLEALGDVTSGLDERIEKLERSPVSPRVVADGVKIALKELASEPHGREILRSLLAAMYDHLADASQRAVGRKLLALLGSALLAAALFLVARKW